MLPFRAELGIFVVVATAGLGQPAWTQTYPTQNITLQVAFAAGGIADVVARLLGQKLSERFGQAVVVENRGGAGGNLAAKSVSGAAPDGYTILATTTSLAVNETATKNKGFSVDDLRPIAVVAFSPDVLAVHPSNPAKDLKAFIENGKSRSFTFGSAGVGTGPHIGAEYFFREVAKVQAVHVPFTGGAPAVTAAIGNHVDAIVLTLPTVVPFHHARASARHRACERGAQFGRAERADLWRDGVSQRLFGLMGWLLRAGEDARCGGREAQRGDQCDLAGAAGAGKAQDHRLRRHDQDGWRGY